MQSLTFKNMSKAYDGLSALSDVTLHVARGRVHALMGENGAGKSTLIRLIAGVTEADYMTVIKDGQTVPLATPQDAQDAGFRFIHQELNIVPQLSVAENILLGHDFPRRFGVAIDWPRLRTKARDALAVLGVEHIDVAGYAGDLSAGDRMLVKIAAAFVADTDRPADLYVLDEPTAALTGPESEKLFAVIARLTSRGAAMIYVSHRIDEVMRICDDVTVLRDGRQVSTWPLAGTSKDEIIHAMTGRDLREAYPPRTAAIGPQIVARITDASTAHLSDISLTLHAGEILGVAGLAEAGQCQLLEMFLGLERVKSGSATYCGADLPANPASAWARGIAYLPKERRAQALMLAMPIAANIVLPHLGRYGLLARRRQEWRDAGRMGDSVRLKCDGLGQAVQQLSGGNQQKVVFARAMQGQPKLLLLDEPTRGVDIGAKFDIYASVRALSVQGCAVIVASTDLPELLGMCDRILVLHSGRQAHLAEARALTSASLLAHFYPTDAKV